MSKTLSQLAIPVDADLRPNNHRLLTLNVSQSTSVKEDELDFVISSHIHIGPITTTSQPTPIEQTSAERG